MLEINIIAPFGHSFLKLVTYLINTTAKNSSQKNKINKIKEFLPCFALPCLAKICHHRKARRQICSCMQLL